MLRASTRLVTLTQAIVNTRDNGAQDGQESRLHRVRDVVLERIDDKAVFQRTPARTGKLRPWRLGNPGEFLLRLVGCDTVF